MKSLILLLFLLCFETYAHCENINSVPFFQGELDNNTITLGNAGHTLSLVKGRIDSDIVWSDALGKEIYRLQTRRARSQDFSRFFYILKDCQGQELVRMKRFRGLALKTQIFLIEDLFNRNTDPLIIEVFNKRKQIELPLAHVILKKSFHRGELTWGKVEQTALFPPEIFLLALQFFREIDTDWDFF